MSSVENLYTVVVEGGDLDESPGVIQFRRRLFRLVEERQGAQTRFFVNGMKFADFESARRLALVGDTLTLTFNGLLVYGPIRAWHISQGDAGKTACRTIELDRPPLPDHLLARVKYPRRSVLTLRDQHDRVQFERTDSY